jgi:hypothetical protein
MIKCPFKLASSLSAMLLLAACGRSEMGFDELEDISPPDSNHEYDAGPDASNDVSNDTQNDVKYDVAKDTTPDVPADGKKCSVDSDCNDNDACTVDKCYSTGVCYYTKKDLDGDGHYDTTCGGDDCNDLNPAVYPGHAEDCTDGTDNDCNGVADCLDPVCKYSGSCGCVPNPSGELCNNGKDDNCDGMVDCNDPLCLGTTACGCLAKETGLCQNGVDDDCDTFIDCDDSDCYSDALCSCSKNTEDCTDGKDNNCNLLVDCADPQCAGNSACSCLPPGMPENCSDHVDNDCDGLVDCADSNCFQDKACETCSQEVCSDGKDNDCNNLIDCADPACHYDPSCTPKTEICDNGIDDDLDGKIDCEDPDCKGNQKCAIEQSNCLNAKLITGSGIYTGNTTGHKNYTKGSCGGDNGESVFYFTLNAPTKVVLQTINPTFDTVLYIRKGNCDQGKEIACDDDSGGQWGALIDIPILNPGTYFVFVDGFTYDAAGNSNSGPFTLKVDLTVNPPEICDNGIDDDGDQYVDCADSDCTNVGKCYLCNSGNAPKPEFGTAACTDGVDDDCDGKADCADSDCNASDYYKTECCNGKDDNGNMIIDDFACRCASDADCPTDQICYTHTTFVCGPPCNAFFGSVCPFVAAGSSCSDATGQCEFPSP